MKNQNENQDYLVKYAVAAMILEVLKSNNANKHLLNKTGEKNNVDIER